MSAETLRSAKGLFNRIILVKEAITAFKTGGVDAMHDPTEGGIIGGVYEMAEASKLGVRILEEKIPVQPETARICKFFDIDPLQLVSSGALLIAAKPKDTSRIIEELEQKNIQASVIGEFLKDPSDRALVKKNGALQVLPKPASDHLWMALSRE
jgi:hydrogenase maturation factor